MGKHLGYISVAVAVHSAAALAGSLPIDPSLFSNPAALLDPTTAGAIVKTVGLYSDHRPYEPATPLGTAVGLDLSVELTLVKVPDDFNAALRAAGLLPGSEALPILPIPKVHLHKGMGENVDIGGSFIVYQGYTIIGGDFKVAVARPEEGPTWAVRLNYTHASVLVAQTHTLTPQVLMSRQLDFADPYIGIGYQYTWGKVDVNDYLNLPAGAPTFPATSASAGAFQAFLGVGFRPPHTGLKLTIEGSYNSAGAHTLGTKFGFCF